MEFLLRMANIKDTEAILAIYAPYVQETAVTFEYEIPTKEEFQTRIEKISEQYPYLVYEKDGRILGYAYANRFRERAGFQFHAELSVYVKQENMRKGVGKALYGALIEILELQGVQNAYGAVSVPNEKSQKLHQYFGFREVGIFPRAGYKLGSWRDLIYFQKQIGIQIETPLPILSVHQVEKQKIEKILQKFGSR